MHGRHAAGLSRAARWRAASNEQDDFEEVTYLRLAPSAADEGHLDRAIEETGKALAAAMDAAGAALLHAEASGALAMAAAFAAQEAGRPLLLEIQDLVEPDQALTSDYAASEAFGLRAGLTAAAMRRAVITIMGDTHKRDILRRHGAGVEAVEIVATGLPALDLPPPPRDAALAEELGLGDAQLFGYVGDLCPASRPERLVHVLDRLRDSHPEARLLLAGSGASADMLRDAAARLRLSNRVAIVERASHSHTAAFLSLLDVAAFAGGADGVIAAPDAVREAMATGRAIVAAMGGGDLLEHGQTALIVPPDDIAAMAGAIAGLFDDAAQRARLGAAARAALGETSSPAAASRTLDALYRRALAGPAIQD